MTIHIKTCAACGKVIGINQRRCASCDASRVGWVSPRQKQYDKKRDPEEVKFRRSRQWRMTRDYIMQRDGYLCQECRKHGRYTIASEVHHIAPLWKDFNRRLDDDNLISLCHRCHMRLEPPRPGEVDR